MKRNYYNIFVLGLSLFFTFSCSESILEKEPLDAISDVAVWSDPALVQSFVNARYNQISHGWYSEAWEGSMCDEMFLTWSRSCEPINQGYVSPSTKHSMNGGHWGETGRDWGTEWKNIGACNAFFDNIDNVVYTDPAVKNQLVGEITFIRALMYWDLVYRWGGMPLITKSYNINTVSEIYDIKRNSYKDNIDFLVAECDKAAGLLPASFTGSDKGRATKVAALALKSRILLYAASPLMNDARSDDPDNLVHYATPDANRWKKAADAAQAALDAALDGGYKLFDSYGDDVKAKYDGIFLEGGNSEVLFDREGGSSTLSLNLGYIDEANGPNGYGSWGGNTPISEFVDDFEMADGTRFNWSNPVHAANPYLNRDPRLYFTVLCNGDMWKGRAVESFFFKKADGTETGGQDTKYGGNSWNTSASGYNVRKFLRESHVVNSWNFAPRNWIWFRLAEVYLNLAEAKYNSGDEAGAKVALNAIRDRARMPQVTSSGTQLWNDIVYERRVELAFEEHRYFDERRWKIAETVLNRNATGIRVFKNSDGTFTYTPGQFVEERKFISPRMYWLPIQLDEINKNPNLQQNPGY